MVGINALLVFVFVVSTFLCIALFPKEKNWIALLLTSLATYYFIIGDKILIVLAIAGATYLLGNLLAKNSKWTIPSILLLLVPLIIFKSFNEGSHFENHQASSLLNINSHQWHRLFHIVGLSYFTFNALSYLIDIQRKYLKAERNFFKVLLYLTFFPALLAGPLHRAKYLFKELENIQISQESIARGGRLILWGLFKGMVIAQRLEVIINQLYNAGITGFYYFLYGTLFFIYLYCNFSAFVDFFQGVAQLFGIRLKDNFKNRVYLSSSRQDYWKGWHITLNEWFRDYFFFVFASYDRKRIFTDLLLLLTFIVIALWHEFSWVLLLWGTLNGCWIILEKRITAKQKKKNKVRQKLGILYHLSLASILALTFIAPDVPTLLQQLFQESSALPASFIENHNGKILIILLSLGMMDYHYFRAGQKRFDEYLGNLPSLRRWLIYLQLIVMLLLFGINAGIDNYYMQF